MGRYTMLEESIYKAGINMQGQKNQYCENDYTYYKMLSTDTM